LLTVVYNPDSGGTSDGGLFLSHSFSAREGWWSLENEGGRMIRGCDKEYPTNQALSDHQGDLCWLFKEASHVHRLANILALIIQLSP